MYLPMLSDDELVRFVESNIEATDCEKRLAARIAELQTEANETEVAAERDGSGSRTPAQRYPSFGRRKRGIKRRYR